MATLRRRNMRDSNLREFLHVNLDKTKEKYLRSLGIRNPKYVETLKMFENLVNIADSLCQRVDSDDDFEKLKHRVVPVHPFAVRDRRYQCGMYKYVKGLEEKHMLRPAGKLFW